MPRYHNINGVEVQFTSDEETARDAEEAAVAAAEPASKWASVRSKRDALLSSCDWMATSDVTMSDVWKAYRQALRDVPSQSDVDNITWPTEPD